MRTVLPLHAGTEHNEIGFKLAEMVVIQFPALHDLRRKAFGDHIGSDDQTPCQVTAFRPV
jgi:hypothetical protein